MSVEVPSIEHVSGIDIRKSNILLTEPGYGVSDRSAGLSLVPGY
jgi:hypothetical protein